MNSWIIVFLNGGVGVDLLALGSFPSLDEAMRAIISSGQPFNLQPAQVWGPGPTVPDGTADPQPVSVGAWIAVCSGVSPTGGVQLIGYGTFADKGSAQAWASKQQTPSAFSFGQVMASL